ncbi:MAG: TonB-dependent receptor, partial [Flavobacteriales bacterium]|nr:TonB-dependent receptor [Flavobacteriales bacterium]
LKQNFNDGNGTVTVALFRINKEGDLRDGIDGGTEQAGETYSQGIEIEAQYQWSGSLATGLFATALKAEFEEFNEKTGNTPSNVADEVVYLWATYRIGQHWQVGGNVFYVGDRFMDDSNTMTMDSYSITDLHATRMINNFELTFRARNVFDEDYSFWSQYDNAHQLGDPRSLEVSVYTSF